MSPARSARLDARRSVQLTLSELRRQSRRQGLQGIEETGGH